MVKYDLSKTTGDVADGGSDDNGPFTYNDSDGVILNLSKHTINTAYTIYKHQPPKDTGRPSLTFNGDDITPGKYSPSEKLETVDVYFLRYNNGQGGGQVTHQDSWPFLAVFNAPGSETGPGGSGASKKIYHFGDPSGSGNPWASESMTKSAFWSSWEELQPSKYIDDTGVRLQMKLKQIDRALNKLGSINDVRSNAYKILKAEDGQYMVKFISGQNNENTVAHKEEIKGGLYYKNIFATWINGGSTLGPNCLLEVDGSGESKCREPIESEDSIKNKIDQYFIKLVKREQYKVIKAYFDTKSKESKGQNTNIKDNLLLVEFVDEKDTKKYLRRRDMNGNWWSLRDAGYVSEKNENQLARKLGSISSALQYKKVAAFFLDSNEQYKGVPDVKPVTNKQGYNVYSHNLNGPNTSHKTVLLFGGEVTKISDLKPSGVKPKTVQVYYLKRQCKEGRQGEAEDEYPFLVVLEGTGTRDGSGTRIYHFGDPLKYGASKGSNYWSNWKPFKKTNKESDVTERLEKKLSQIHNQCNSLQGGGDQARRKRVYDILTHVDIDQGEVEDPATEEDEGADDGTGQEEEEEEDEVDKEEEEDLGTNSQTEEAEPAGNIAKEDPGSQGPAGAAGTGAGIGLPGVSGADGSLRDSGTRGHKVTESVTQSQQDLMMQNDSAGNSLQGTAPGCSQGNGDGKDGQCSLADAVDSDSSLKEQEEADSTKYSGVEPVGTHVAEVEGAEDSHVVSQTIGQFQRRPNDTAEASSLSRASGGSGAGTVSKGLPGANGIADTSDPAGTEVSRGGTGESGFQGSASNADSGGFSGSTRSSDVTQSEEQGQTFQSHAEDVSMIGPGGQDGASLSGASNSQCISQGTGGRNKRATTTCPMAAKPSLPGSPGSPGSGTTPNESGNTVITIVTASGGTVAGVAALSGGGYLWHWMGTRTVRDMMVYF